ncbi:hypothetical protein OF83DRAFT_843338 [Amylostereum chailletii]|nr:hypothetical protein OF83DRAFT_843338 [Amylostereum chailletii]
MRGFRCSGTRTRLQSRRIKTDADSAPVLTCAARRNAHLPYPPPLLVPAHLTPSPHRTPLKSPTLQPSPPLLEPAPKNTRPHRTSRHEYPHPPGPSPPPVPIRRFPSIACAGANVTARRTKYPTKKEILKKEVLGHSLPSPLSWPILCGV